MKLDKAIELQRALVTRLRDAYSDAKSFHSTSEALDARVRKLYADLPRDTPNHVREFGRGYALALNDRLYEAHLVYGGYVDGVFYSTHSNRPDYYGAHGIEPREYADDGRVTRRGHYWRDDTSKPFYARAGGYRVESEFFATLEAAMQYRHLPLFPGNGPRGLPDGAQGLARAPSDPRARGLKGETRRALAPAGVDAFGAS